MRGENLVPAHKGNLASVNRCPHPAFGHPLPKGEGFGLREKLSQQVTEYVLVPDPWNGGLTVGAGAIA